MTRLSVALLAAALVGCGGASETSTDAPAAERNQAAVEAADAKAEAKPAEKTMAKTAPAAETTQPSTDGWIDYGTGMSDTDAVAASAVIGAPTEYLGKTVKVEGEVAEVCKSMGCWLSFQHEGQELVVNMKDHGFSVDKQGAGSWCEAEGEVVKQGELYSLTAHAVRMKKSAEAPAKDEAPAAETKGEAQGG